MSSTAPAASANTELEPLGPRARAGTRSSEPRAGFYLAATLGVACALLAPALVFFLARRGLGLLASEQARTLRSTRWFPAEGVFGLVPLIGGSALVSLGGLALAWPVGLGTALTLRFYARGRLARLGEALLGVLGGIPSVVFGLFGTYWLVPRLGPSLASAALVLAAMLAPTLALLSLAALRQLPVGLLEDGCRLGLTREQVIARLALSAARPALVSAGVLALARGLGEALAVEMVCGNVAGLPASMTDPVRTLTTTLVQEFEYASGAHAQALHLVALAVVLIAALAAGLALRRPAARRTS
jgi:phosphate transport system permease protein